ncbi:uncharacterized protein [Coffea arabica]|uniref:Reverse transcriptase zinc-binding domain-containing protein n=1 Tax=Coffea arabica TaxID=13443 RepID=A0ABM4V3D5_COFAR
MTLSAWSRSLNLNSKKEIKRIKEEIQAARTRHGNNNKEAIKLLRKQLSDAYKQEELFWNQRTRTKWLQTGDKNSAYFHAVVRGRRKRNRITSLERDQGGWCTTEEEIGEEIAQFYNQLFTSSKPSEFDKKNGICTCGLDGCMVVFPLFLTLSMLMELSEANGDEAGQIKELLECYGKASGQQINISKSSVFFSKNTGNREKEEVLQKLGGIQQPHMERKEVLLKSVAMALPSYAMSEFRLSKSLCKELSGMMARFWWGNDQREKRLHWKKWTDLADRKENGALGFRDLLCFNEALLAKQAGALWIWQSLHSSLEMLESGVWKQVGDGTTVEIWNDRWIDCTKFGKVSSPKPNGCQLTKVSNLIEGKQWNKDIIQALFSKEEAEAILLIPLSVFQKKDRFKWRHTANGFYSTKSRYAKAKERIKEVSVMNRAQVNSSTNKERSKVWNQLWGLNMKHKIKHFLWKCLHCILPTNEKIFRRTGKGDPLCKCCGKEQETTEHALLHCKTREMAWATFPVSWDGIKDYKWNFWKWWEHMQEARSRKDGTKHIEATANLLWQIWNARNE